MHMRGITVLLCVLCGPAALAQESIYVGIGLGSFDYAETARVPVLGKVADKVSAQKLFGGFEINDYFALEISYGKTSDIRQSGTENIDPFGDVTVALETDYSMTVMRAMGQLPFDWGLLLGGLGYYSSANDFNEVTSAACCNSLVNAGTIREDGLMATVGIEWRFGRFGTRYGVRLEYEWWDLSNVDVSIVGLALSYGF
jgi:hypothetical protein